MSKLGLESMGVVGMVGADDILTVLGDWGACNGCPGDIDGDGFVGVDDMLTIIGAFGPC